MLSFVIKTVVEDRRPDLIGREAAISINCRDQSVRKVLQSGVCSFQLENARPYFIRRHPSVTIFRNSSGHVCASIAASNLLGLAGCSGTAGCEDDHENNQNRCFIHRIVVILFWQGPFLRLGIRKRHNASRVRALQHDGALRKLGGLPECGIQVRRISDSLCRGILPVSFRDRPRAVAGQRFAWVRQGFALAVPSQSRFASTISRLILCH